MEEKTQITRITEILDSCRNDAIAQLAVLREMITTGESSDIKAMAIMALAAENTSATFQRYRQLSLTGSGHELAHTPA